MQPALNDSFLPQEKLLYSLHRGLLGWTSKHMAAQVGGLNPEGISPHLRARMLAFTCKMSILVSMIDRVPVAPYTQWNVLKDKGTTTCGD